MLCRFDIPFAEVRAGVVRELDAYWRSKRRGADIPNWSDIDPEYGRFPAWFPVLVISRDAVILVGAAVLYLLNGKVHVKPRWSGKVATVSQMIAIGWVMLQFRFIPLFYIVIGAGFFTLLSGVVYVMDGVRQLQAEGHAHATKH